jgi:hypothetical protein
MHCGVGAGARAMDFALHYEFARIYLLRASRALLFIGGNSSAPSAGTKGPHREIIEFLSCASLWFHNYTQTTMHARRHWPTADATRRA